jgi:hypothetical protein
VLKFLIEEGAFVNETQEEAFLSADVVCQDEKDERATDSHRIQVFNPQADMGLLQEGEAVRRDSRELVGLSSNQMGEFNVSSRRSATEASIVNQASNIRMDRRQSKVAFLYKDIFRIVNPITGVELAHSRLACLVQMVSKTGVW